MKKNRVHNTGLYRERKNKDGYDEQGISKSLFLSRFSDWSSQKSWIR